MPHGRLFHALLMDYDFQSDHPQVNLPDILRIGSVWFDLVVRYQFYYYDMIISKWIKTFSRTEDDYPDNMYVWDKGAS